MNLDLASIAPVSDTAVTPAKQLQAGSASLCSPRQSRGKKWRCLKESTPGELPEDAVSLQNARGSEKRSAQGQEMAAVAREGLREDVIDGRGGEAVTDRPPPSRPRAPITHMRGPRTLGLLPPRGQQPPSEEDEPTTSCFRGCNPEATPAPRRRSAP